MSMTFKGKPDPDVSGARRFWGRMLIIFAAAGLACAADAQFVSFYDHAPGRFTHSNAVDYGVAGSGLLKNVANGASVGVTVTVTNSGAVYYPYAGVPDYGTPASIVFEGFVDFGGQPNPSITLPASSSVLAYTFSGLDPNSEYNFQGSAMRGDWSFTNQWSRFQLVGAATFTSAHSAGALTTAQVPSIASNEVAINTGNNVQGVLAGWEHIRPGASGTFSVICRQYTGPVPGGSSGGTAYGINGFRLEQGGSYSGRSSLPPRQPNLAPNSLGGLQTVFVLLFENKDWSAILGGTNCPYINNALLPIASYCNQYNTPHALHPSEANYLWLLTGTNFGIRDDNAPSVNHQNTTNTLFHLLDQAGIPWRTYQENISGTNIPDASVGQYLARHNPFVFFDEVRTNLAYCTNHVRPYTELAADLANNTVARFNFLTPNLTNDMHSAATGGGVAQEILQGDQWLSREMPKILASSAYSNGGAIFIAWDETTDGYDGPFGMIVLSPRAKGGGYNNSIYYTHSATLRTFQNIFGVRPYLGDALFSNDLSDLFKTIQISSAQWTKDGFSLTVTNVTPGKTNFTQFSTDLAAANWTTIQTNIATVPSQTIIDSSPSDSPARFYRIIELP
jgi:hypothetical protein